MGHMDIHLTAEQEAFVRAAVAAGRLKAPYEALQQALLLWEERERARMEILAALDEAEASLARGAGIEITEESMHKLAEHIKQRGRACLAARQTVSSQSPMCFPSRQSRSSMTLATCCGAKH